jgi:hypothetical protein
MACVNLISSSTPDGEEDEMKTLMFTLLLSIAFLSAGAFAGNSYHAANPGFSVAYKTN